MGAHPPGASWWGLLLGSQRRAPRTESVVREADLAAAAGLRVMVAPQHLRSEPYLTLQPFPLLGAVRAAVPGVGTVACVIAGLDSTEQLLLDLRTVAGVGSGPAGVALAAGYRPEDFEAAGRSFGDRFRARAASLAALEPGPWRWLCASTPRAARTAAAAGAPWYGGPALTEGQALELAAAAAAAGILRRDVVVASSPDAVRARFERHVAPKLEALRSWSYRDTEIVAGTPAEVAERLLGLRDRLRPVGVVLRLVWPDMDGDEALRHLELFGERVLPELG